MARWRLTEPHYLNVEGVKWEYMEVDRTTGRQIRKQYDVPSYYHHEAEGDWNDKVNNWVVVSDGHNAQPRDIIFRGEPTPGMYPLDDEARAITDKHKHKWKFADKMFDLNSPGDYGTRLADHFVQMQDKVNMQMSELESKRAQGFDQFLVSMTSMMQQNQKILEMLAVKQSGAAPVVDDLEPLPPVEEPKPDKNRVGRRF
jgi:hypothetical protein